MNTHAGIQAQNELSEYTYTHVNTVGGGGGGGSLPLETVPDAGNGCVCQGWAPNARIAKRGQNLERLGRRVSKSL